MSYRCFFSMSVGLKSTIQVPEGTSKWMIQHVAEVETLLKLKRTKYKDNPVHWDSFNRNFKGVDDKVLCETIESHNRQVVEFYEQLSFWAEHPFTVGKGHQDVSPNTAYPVGTKSENLTPEIAATFWHGLEILEVPLDRWTREYYTDRMEALYDIMRGREREGISFDEKPLTPRQAAQVINIFSPFLDRHDCRLDVPKGHDYLASSYDGGYDWCEKCGAVTPEDGQSCSKRKCPVREERE